MRKLITGLSVLSVILALSCSEDEVIDTTAPATPVASLLHVSGPDGQGRLTVSGEAGAVEGGATVEVYNQNPSVTDIVTTGAAGNGSFQLEIAGEYFDRIGVTAIDAAGNRGPTLLVVAGAPFSLLAVSGEGQTGEVCSILADSLVWRVEDGDGLPVEGVEVYFTLAAGEGSFSPDTTLSDAAGRVATQLTLGETAGELSVFPSGTELSFDVMETIEATALPGPPAALAWVEGEGQKDGPGQTLFEDLVVQVQDAYGNGVSGIALSLSASDGGSVSPDAGISDSSGCLSCQWTLGPVYGAQSLNAQADGLPDAAAGAEADDPPFINSVNPSSLVFDPGDDIYIDGGNFCETDSYNTLLLDEVPLEITGASETQINAEIPLDIDPGIYVLSLSVGHQQAPQTYEVEIALPLGRVEDYPFSGGEVEVDFLVPGSGTSYTVIPYSLEYWDPYPDYEYSTYSYGVESAGLLRGGELLREEGPVEAFHRRLLTPQITSPPPPPAPSGGREGVIAAREDFYCLNNAYAYVNDPDAYTTVTASLRYDGSHTRIYVDNDTPADYLTQAHINEIGDRFNQQDYVTDTSYFGAETDIDGNGKVMVLLSPVVNGLTTWSDGSYIGGFFNPADLNVWWPPAGISNSGEIFYAIVPDPDGIFSPVHHPIASTVEGIKSILVHEFQHMINMGQRHIIQGNAMTPKEQLWLNEGLSHLAENLCSYNVQNTARVKLYLHGEGPSITSLTQGPSTLAERGGCYLFCRYLEDRWPGTTLDLIGGPTSGPANVNQAVAQAEGLSFAEVFKDWAAALYLDDRDLNGDGTPDDLGPAYRFTSHNIRTDFPPLGGSEPLEIYPCYFHDPVYNGYVVPTGLDYLQFAVAGGHSPPEGGSITLRFSGTNGELGVLVIRCDN